MGDPRRKRRTLEELCRLLDASGARLDFDPNRSLSKPCVFCRSADVRLVVLGRLKDGRVFTRPACGPCKQEWEL